MKQYLGEYGSKSPQRNAGNNFSVWRMGISNIFPWRSFEIFELEISTNFVPYGCISKIIRKKYDFRSKDKNSNVSTHNDSSNTCCRKLTNQCTFKNRKFIPHQYPLWPQIKYTPGKKSLFWAVEFVGGSLYIFWPISKSIRWYYMKLGRVEVET